MRYSRRAMPLVTLPYDTRRTLRLAIPDRSRDRARQRLRPGGLVCRFAEV